MSSHINSNIHKGKLSADDFHGINKQYAIILNSAVSNYTYPNGDAFIINFDTPISIPRNAVNCNISLFQANIWNSSPNILTGKNDKFYYSIGGNPMKTITLEQGLYSLSDLSLTLSVLIQNAGDPKDSIILFGNTATQRVEITGTYANTVIYFNQPQSLKDILGFEAQAYTIVGAGNTIIAPKVANLNTINAFLVLLDILDNGIPVGNRSSSILAQVPIIAKPNSLITYEPRTPVKIQCDSLIGKQISTVNVRITNELLQEIVVIEPYNVLIMIDYEF
jgi:hypothetical protein